MLIALLQSLGWILAHTPELALRGLAAGLGQALYYLLPRRRLILSNLVHAFPERPLSWHRRIARTSCRRMIETGLLSLASPYLSEKRLRTIARLSPESATWWRDYLARPPLIVGAPHLAYWESLTWLGLLSRPLPLPEFGVIFRPLDNPAMNAFVKRTRERFGMQLLSRKDGFAEALRILRRRGCVGILFDQNTGQKGALTLLFDRLCSTTELPGLLAEKFGADLVGIYARRQAFWRIEIHLEPLPGASSSAAVTLAYNRWLERLLQEDEDRCASWLWIHNRWRTQQEPVRRFRLEAKRNLLAVQAAARGWSALPRRTRFFIRLPNWLGDVVMALPLLRALRAARPDAELTLIGPAAFAPLAALAGVADRYEPLPARGPAYFRFFWRLRHRYPDTYLLFTHSFRGDLEAWLTRCRQRFGVLRRGRRRPWLTQAYRPPPDFAEREHHQLALWTRFLEHFGLLEPPDVSPLTGPAATLQPAIGLIAGSENNPEKRWPVAHWRALIAALPARSFVLFGTPRDRPLTQAIAADFGSRVEDLAGRTDLPTYLERLRRCPLLVTNDTGGMHLANALGVPLIALFGPTNPRRTGPVFRAPVRILQPPGCAPTGGSPLDALAPATVIAAVEESLLSPLPPA